MKKLLGIVVLGLLLSGNSYASSLKGFSKVELVIEALSPNAESCSITEQKIKTSVQKVLENSKLKAYENMFSNTVPLLYIRIAVQNNSGTCATHGSLKVVTATTNDPLGNGNTGVYTYYENERMAIGGENGNIGTFTIEQLEDMLKELVIVHYSDNQ